MIKMNLLLLGAIAMASMTVAVFFLRYWKNTKDRFFIFFAASFFLEGINRVVLVLTGGLEEHIPAIYFIRLISYLLIIVAIVDKNISPRKGRKHAG